jgi:hypothetical protein
MDAAKMREKLDALKEESLYWSDEMAKSGSSEDYDRLLEVLSEMENLEAALKEQEKVG